MSNLKTYSMRLKALEGEVFYYNKLADKEYVRKYFPPTRNQRNYDNAPKIAVPITSTFVNRIASSLHNGMKVQFSTPAEQAVWESIAEHINWDELTRDLLIHSLVQGNVLAVILQDEQNLPLIDVWKGQYIFEDKNSNSVGYEYILKGSSPVMIPVLSAPDNLARDERLVRVFVNDEIYGQEPHNLGYAPAVMFKNIDKDEDGVYGVPYYHRYRDLNIEYNHIVSQISKAIKILQNVWVTNASQANEDNPIRIGDPDEVVSVGLDGKLEQAIRNLNTEPEHTYMNNLMRLIHNAAQIPDFMSGLSGVGKVESGVALQIVSTPLIELMTRIRQQYKEEVTELVTKTLASTYLFNGNTPPDFIFDVKINDTIIPIDKQQEIDNVIKLVQSSILTTEQAQKIILPLMGLE